MPEQKFIEIRGAREHNLKSIDIDIPRDRLVVITGLSGSGKSSLAFDTIYAEGQRRYVESLSAYARQFLDMMQKPDVDHISGLSPAISIEQKTTSKNPRSTVGTVTEIYDYLRLLFARVGTPFSPVTGLPIEAQQISQMVDITMALPEGTRAYLLAPIVRDRKGEYRKEFQDLRKQGFQRVKVNGAFHDLDAPPELDKKYRHNIDVVVDRIVVREGLETRLADSLRTALDLADGIAILETAPPGGRGAAADHLLGEVRLSGQWLHDSRDRAAAVFVQRAVRRLPGLRRARGRAVLRPAADRARRGADADARRDRALGEGAVALLQADDRGAGAALRVRPDEEAGATCRSRRNRCCSTARRARRSASATTRAGGSTRSARPFEGVIPNMERRYRETDSRLVARGDGALPEQPAVRDLPWVPAEAGGAGGEDRRAARRRGGADVDPRGAEPGSRRCRRR